MRKGFTLIELIVSTLIFSIVISVVIGIYIIQTRKSHEVSEKATLTTEAQLALHVISEEILHSGLGISINEEPIEFTDGGPQNPDILGIRSVLMPLDQTEGRWSVALETGLGSILIRRWADTLRNLRQGDSFLILGPRGEVEIQRCLCINNITPLSDTESIITYTPPLSIQKGRILLEVPNRGVINRTVTYELRGDTLFRNNEIFLEDVEDFQVEFCADWNDDGVLDVNDFRSELPPNYSINDFYTRPLLIRISLLVRSSRGVPGFHYPFHTVTNANRVINLTDLQRRFPREFFTNTAFAKNLKRIE
ncbi:MAG: prepilin-type N-terminal cleavage/methylation domain-containing protein [candidate division WOR-3 bacterium]